MFRKPRRANRQRMHPASRKLRAELLEDRRLLTTYFVENTDNSGAGSLRQAILDANGSSGDDLIEFAIPGPGGHIIAPSAALPAITETVTIDGFRETAPRRALTPQRQSHPYLDGWSLRGSVGSQ